MIPILGILLCPSKALPKVPGSSQLEIASCVIGRLSCWDSNRYWLTLYVSRRLDLESAITLKGSVKILITGESIRRQRPACAEEEQVPRRADNRPRSGRRSSSDRRLEFLTATGGKNSRDLDHPRRHRRFYSASKSACASPFDFGRVPFSQPVLSADSRLDDRRHTCSTDGERWREFLILAW